MLLKWSNSVDWRDCKHQFWQVQKRLCQRCLYWQMNVIQVKRPVLLILDLINNAPK